MNDWKTRVTEIVQTALAKGRDRRTYLDSACGNDAELRQAVESMLMDREETGTIVGKPATVPAAAVPRKSSAEAEPPAVRAAPEPPPTVARPAPGAAAAPPKPLSQGGRVGPYKLQHQLGEGGMGVVWLAEQTEPVRRQVAVKIIRPDLASEDVLARFELERQALALMDHPNIARVLDAGTTADGQPYFVMEVVRGVPFNKYCDEETLTPRQRLELFIPICNAVQHAHQKGIIHRDLKPSNVLIGLYDGKPVPKVIDFGVAKATAVNPAEGTMHTEVGQIIGTLEYMAPEQADATNLDIDTRADIYSLGVMLYDALAGSPPFTGRQLREAGLGGMLRIMREVEPPKPSTKLSTSKDLPAIAARRKLEPRRLRQLIHGDLDWVVMKCLEKDRNRRYETANGLGQDLQRFLADEPVAAGPPSAAYRLRKFVQRNRGPVVAGVLVLLALVGGIVGTTVGLVLAEQARADAVASEQRALESANAERTAKNVAELAQGAEKERAGQLAIALDLAKKRSEELKQERDNTKLERDQKDAALKAAQRVLSNSFVLLAENAWNVSGTAAQAQDYLAQIPVANRRWEWGFLQRKYRGGLFVIPAHAAPVRGVAWSPDGRRIASAADDRSVYIWDARTGELLHDFKGHTDGVTSVAWNGDSTRLASGSLDRTVRIWDARTGQNVYTLEGHTRDVSSVCWNGDNSQVASASSDRTVRIWDAKTGQFVRELEGQTGLTSVAWSSDGSRIVGAGGQLGKLGEIRVWDAKTGTILQQLAGHTDIVNSIAWSGDNSRLASAARREIRIWSAATGKTLHVLTGHTDLVAGVAWSGDSSRLASASYDKQIRVWDARSGESLLEFKGHKGEVAAVAWSADGTRLASASLDTTVRVWNARFGLALPELQGPQAGVSGVAWNHDGDRLATCADKLVRIFDARTGLALRELSGHANAVQGVSWNRDGSRLASASWDKTVRIWNAQSGALVREFTGHSSDLWSVAWSPDGSQLASGGGKSKFGLPGELRIWDPKTGLTQLDLVGHQGPVLGVAWSADGARLASASADKTVRIWDTITGTQLRLLDGHAHSVTSVSWNPDGTGLASASWDNTVRVWDTQTGQCRLDLKGHTAEVRSVSWSSDGSRLASGGGQPQNPELRIWDAHTGQTLLELKGQHTYPLLSVSWSSDSSRLASASVEGTVLVWEGGNGADATEVKLDKEERVRRQWLTRPDPEWHIQKQQEFAREKNVYAVALHQAWEQNARGVVALDRGESDAAAAFFRAAAKLRPAPPAVPQIKSP